MSDVWPLPDASARARIQDQLDRSLLVEAGAGSGKTHEMAARMAAGIASGVYQIEHMAAVTFTRKAAAELRGRFQLALEELLKSHVAAGFRHHEVRSDSSKRWAEVVIQPDADSRARIAHALSNLERFFAGTIHAFCARLLRERPVEAGVAPGFTELDDIQERLLRRENWRDYLAEARGIGDRDLVALQEAGVRMRDLARAFDTICLYEDVDFPPGDAPKPDDRDRWKQLEMFWTQLSAHLPAEIDPETTCNTQRASRRFADAWTFSREKRRMPGVLADLLEIWEFSPKIVQRCWSDNAAEKKRLGALIPALHRQFRTDVVDPFLGEWRRYLYRHCIVLLSRARDGAERERRRRNTLSFNDLLRLTARVLRENEQVRRSLQQKYRWIFIDEFQDTDPLQAEIMLRLAGESSEGRALFVVGDPKQSIYRFRRADIDVYNRVRAILGGSDEAGIVTLTTNFRSRPDICEFANRAFKERFPETATAQKPRFAPLQPNRTAEPNARGIRTLTTEADGVTSERLEEAGKIARYIRAEVDAGRRKFGEFLILTRQKKGLPIYARALEALQVPIEVSGAGAFSESVEVQQLAALLEALADPQDAVALVGVLRGPLFGLSDRELFAYREAGGWFSIFTPSTDRLVSAAPNVVGALGSLGRWFKWTRVLPPGAALERILEDSGYLALAAATPGGVEAGDLLHAIDRVRAAVEAGFTLAQAAESLAAFSGLDEEGPEDSSDVESLPLEPGRGDVVRVMNLHKAKGLEAEVVFLADPLGGFTPRADVRIIRTDNDDRPLGYFEIKPEWGWNPKPIALPADWDRLAAEELEYLAAETDRLLYVAATRAKDVLVVCRCSGKKGNAWAELAPFLPAASELPVPAAANPPAAAKSDLSGATLDRAVATAAAAHHRARQPSWSATSVTAESKRLPRITIGADDVGEDDPTRCVGEDTPSRRADAGLAWGTLIHGLLEHAMRHQHATRDDLRRLAMWLTIETPELRTAIEQALDTVQTVATAEFWQQARASAECYEEVPFAVRDDSTDVPRVVTGTIDLVHRTDDGWRVTDYKTDVDLGNADAQRKYEEQVRWYAAAWSRVAVGKVATSVVAARKPRP
jgi:ATP-dependent helicase/nuclease subunit A